MKPVIIVHNSTKAIQSLNESKGTKASAGDKYTMSGVFTEFDVRNRNDRVYTWDKFKPHLEELQGRIEQRGSIFGEYDHPDVFDFSLSRISHAIKEAKYNKEKNIVEGTIRLTNNFYGKEAKSLVDEGYSMFVSSRAAGVTESNGNVILKKLFTYDLVADPGFESAIVHPHCVNESLSLSKNSPYRIYETANENDFERLMNDNKNNEKVTKTQIEEYYGYLLNEINSLKKQLAVATKTGGIDPVKLNNMFELFENYQKDYTKITGYLNYLSEATKVGFNKLNEKTDKLGEFGDYIVENVEKVIQHNDHLVEVINENGKTTEKLVEYNNYIRESLNNVIRHNDMIVEQVNKLESYSNYIAENYNKLESYSNYIAENVNKSHKRQGKLHEGVKNLEKHSDYVISIINKHIDHSDAIVEAVNDTIGYMEYVKGFTEKNIKYTDYIAEGINKLPAAQQMFEQSGSHLKQRTAPLQKKTSKTPVSLNESRVSTEAPSKKITNTTTKKPSGFSIGDTVKVAGTSRVGRIVEISESKAKIEIFESQAIEFVEKDHLIKLSEKSENTVEMINSLITEAKKRKASEIKEPHFFFFLNETDKKNFNEMKDSDRETIISALNESKGYSTRNEVVSIMREALSVPTETVDEALIRRIPENLKPIWESLDAQEKKNIMLQSRWHQLTDDRKVESFWNTRGLEKINEDSSFKTLIQEDPYNTNQNLNENQMQAMLNRLERLK